MLELVDAYTATVKKTSNVVLRNMMSFGTDFPRYGKNTDIHPRTVAKKRVAIDKMPNATVGSLGNLHMTTSFPGTGVPNGGFIQNTTKQMRK